LIDDSTKSLMIVLAVAPLQGEGESGPKGEPGPPASPGPPEQPTKFELNINRIEAKVLGLDVSPTLPAIADEEIE